jgi:L-2-hydroxyglutarate oxidase
VPVAGPYTYRGFFRNPAEAIKKIFEQPVANKIALLYNRDFLELAGQEWLSSISKGEMARRAREFIPELKVEYLKRPGIAGVRAQVIDRKGNFIKEAIELQGPRSYHITNYNSPGATGSPAFAAWLVSKLGQNGKLNHLRRAAAKEGLWDFNAISEQIDTPAR